MGNSTPDRFLDVDSIGDPFGLAVIEALVVGEVFAVCFHKIRELEHQIATITTHHCAPLRARVKRSCGSIHRFVDVGLVGGLDGGDDLLCLSSDCVTEQVRISPVMGLMVSNVAPFTESTNSPLMKCYPHSAHQCCYMGWK